MSTPERKKLIRQLRDAGAQACRDGKSIHTCPETFMNAFQWRTGWWDEFYGSERLCDE